MIKFAALLTLACAIVVAAAARRAEAIDFYEIQIYPTETEPQRHLSVELHSNTVTTATGEQARDAIGPYQIHETLESTYGVLPFLEVGQYLCTAKLDNGHYEYAGARTKMHFGVPMTDDWPVRFGGNLELAYMRRQAEENPLTLEMRPIAETDFHKFTLIGNFSFEKPFSGPGTHDGVTFSPSGLLSYEAASWITPALEYYGDMGPVSAISAVQRQQHFIVPTVNLNLLAQLEFNFGVGFGVTRASNGVFVKSIVGWSF